MRVAQSFDDVNAILRDVFATLDNLRTRDLDMAKRRVVNASPSQNEYDYVVRKELEQFTRGTTVSATPSTATGFYTVVFSNSGTIRTAQYASSPYIMKRRSAVLGVYAVAVEPPSAGTSQFNVWHGSSISVLNTDLAMPSTTAAFEVVGSTDLNVSTVEIDELLTLEVVAGEGAKKVTVEVLLQEL
jgi:hypothetical protein